MSIKLNSIQEKIIEGLQLPTDVMLGAAILTLSDNRILKVENLKGILSCDPELIRLLCKRFRIEIIGQDMILHAYSKDEIIITGRIESIQYISRGE